MQTLKTVATPQQVRTYRAWAEAGYPRGSQQHTFRIGQREFRFINTRHLRTCTGFPTLGYYNSQEHSAMILATVIGAAQSPTWWDFVNDPGCGYMSCYY